MASPERTIRVTVAKALAQAENDPLLVDKDLYIVVKVGSTFSKSTRAARLLVSNIAWNEIFEVTLSQAVLPHTNLEVILTENPKDQSETNWIAKGTYSLKDIAQAPISSDVELITPEDELLGEVTLNFEPLKPKEDAAQSANSQADSGKRSTSQSKLHDVEVGKPQPSKGAVTDDLQQKMREIQQRLDNLQVKIKVEPSSSYIHDTVNKALFEGLMKVSKDRPVNPIRELGLFLLNYEDKKIK